MSGARAAARALSERLLRMAERAGDDELRSRRIIAAGRRGCLPAIRQKHASTPTPAACSTIRTSMRPIVSSMAAMIPALAPGTLARRPNGCSDILRRRSQASLMLWRWPSGSPTRSRWASLLQSSSLVHLNRREPERALRQLEAAEALAEKQRISLLYEPRILRGVALLGQGAVEESVARIREGVTNWTRLGRTGHLPYGLAFLAEGLARHGDRAAALAALREGLEIVSTTGEHRWDAELHRTNGRVLLTENKLDEAQASFQQAIRIAQAQQAKSLELRAARDLARLWGEQGRRAEARDLLSPVYGWFTEGFDTADLKEAKALLDELT